MFHPVPDCRAGFCIYKHLYMTIENIFGEQIEVTDLNEVIKEANQCLGFAQAAWKAAGGYPNVKFIERNGAKHTLVAFHAHNLRALLELLPPIATPEWLFIGTFPTCYSYADKRKEQHGDYKTVLRLFYNPLRIEITAANKRNYPEVLELAKEKLRRLQARVNEPLVVTASGQTTELNLSDGPDIVIVK